MTAGIPRTSLGWSPLPYLVHVGGNRSRSVVVHYRVYEQLLLLYVAQEGGSVGLENGYWGDDSKPKVPML